MAKRSKDGAGATHDRLSGFAADLGRLLGTVQGKASGWLDQRKTIADQLTQIRDTANDYLQQLTGGGANMAVAVRRGRRGSPPAVGKRKLAAAPQARRPKRTLSAAARKRISDAQKARWAKQRAAKKP